MKGDIRTTLPPRHGISASDVAAEAFRDTTRYARRFSLDIAEDALAQMGPMAVEHIAKQLAENVVHRHQGDIENAVHSYLTDRAWAEPIIRDAIYRAVREFVGDLLGPEKS